ncbi:MULTISPECIES: ANTAR domain-containing protein [Cryobacterium]|uniref:ANTAR domain-containing protein n=1 Tax=Cryobacterium TaxID=69578 RepID=UPI0013FD1620
MQHALDSRILIEHAKGVVVESAEPAMDEVFVALRKHARHHRLTLITVATAVIDRSIGPKGEAGSHVRILHGEMVVSLMTTRIGSWAYSAVGSNGPRAACIGHLDRRAISLENIGTAPVPDEAPR